MVPTEPVGIRRGSPGPARDRAVVRRGFGEGFSDEAGRGCPAGRRIGSGQPPAQHKSIAGGCLFPGARGHSAGQEPESRDAGVSRFVGNGSYLAKADGADAVARQDGNPGSSGFHETGSHLAATDAAEGRAGHVDDPGSSGNAENGSHLAVVRRNAPLPGQKPDAQTRQCSSTSARTGALFDKSPMLPLPTWGTAGHMTGGR